MSEVGKKYSRRWEVEGKKMILEELRKEIEKVADKTRAQQLMRYFKTGKGGYSAGDVFVGLTVPQSRIIAKQFSTLSLSDVDQLLNSGIHEERLIALFVLTSQYEKGDKESRTKLYHFYLAHTHGINNWDLVDASAHKILGEYVAVYCTTQEARDVLHALATSDNLWEKRIAIIATFAFLKRKNSILSLEIAEILLHDSHDLIHKAVGWTLREVGKQVCREELEEFLVKHYHTMPRTTLRYAIEHFPEEKRKRYLKGEN